jgi:hypothetical protein
MDGPLHFPGVQKSCGRGFTGGQSPRQAAACEAKREEKMVWIVALSYVVEVRFKSWWNLVESTWVGTMQECI